MNREDIINGLYGLSVAEYQIYKDPKIKNGICVNSESDELRYEIGLIAQQIEKTFPHLIRYVNGKNDADGIKVDYPMLIPILVLVIQEQKIQIERISKKC